ncbi:D-alanyl-D-alanine carboxypeptidase family protein [Metabacillus dongyingensis]|uniref:D-alanyl-D-alanine carboxypeptidase family protein n=1 Tax=Metabacillus dongyingensis TaxID=2874282 RepID=UPI001CC17F3E|nr:D-alanyl-D-alanine carboxypeptidase family protein [Metabacillus dongyingensis]UAL50871.1 D-alanyl-D-alanine carboxypeptidase [Metabacillus dongyingensis]
MRQWKQITAIVLIFFLLISVPRHSSAEMGVSARSAILIEQESGRVLFEKDAHTKRRIASITKIMTAILAIESGKMDEKATVSNRAIHTEGSAVYLQEGEKIKLEDLVYGLMLRSGNDAAVAIAEHVGGSVEGFVHLMNQKAAEIGMMNTEFANPHGLDDHENHYSSAYDMAILTRYAMENPIYQKISETKVHRAPNPNEQWDRVWRNKNKLLTSLYEYSTGGKTGYTKRAKRTLVSTAQKDGMNLVAVTIDASDDWNDHIGMFNMAFSKYNLFKIKDSGTLKNIKVKDKIYKNKLFIKRDVFYPLTEEEEDKLRINVSLLKPEKNWDDPEDVPNVVGKITIIVEDERVDEVPVYYDNGLTNKPDATLFEKLRKLFFIGAGFSDYD